MIYTEIEENKTAEIVVKKSKFICNLYKINSKEDADKIIQEAKKNYHDARHNCYAYIIYDLERNMLITKFSDDGEPAGTAGVQILNALSGNNVVNVLAIVTRYFGGILLGTGGLIRAYKEATIECLWKSVLVNVEKGYVIRLKTTYEDNENIMYFCKKYKISIIKTEYLDSINHILELNEENLDKLNDNFKNKGIKIDIIRQKTIKTA